MDIYLPDPTEAEIQVTVEFASIPRLPKYRLRVPRFLRPGDFSLTFARESQPDFGESAAESCWLTVTASKAFNVPGPLEARYFADPGATAEAVDSELADGVRASLSALAELVAGAATVHLPSAAFERWQEARATEVPVAVDGYDVDDTAMDLATHYLAAVLSDLRIRSEGRIRITPRDA